MTIDTAAQTTAARGIPADTFGNRLMLARAQAGHISIREAAELCGVGRGAWANWEKGAQPEGYDALTDLIADKLGCDRDWLRHGGTLRRVDDRRPRWSRSGLSTRGYHSDVITRPSDRRPSGRPASHRPPPGPGRTSRVQRPVAA